MIKPIYVHYHDNGEAMIFNLTQEQYDRIRESSDDYDEINKRLAVFEIKQPDLSTGYIPEVVAKLAELYDFEVGTE